MIGGTSNISSQYAANQLDDDPENDQDINLGSVLGSAFGAAWSGVLTSTPGMGPTTAFIVGWAQTAYASAIGTELGKQGAEVVEVDDPAVASSGDDAEVIEVENVE